jgi:protein gp37
MADKSRIEWTDASWTPIRARRLDTGKVGVHCERVSPACQNCYAATFNRRNLPSHGTGLDFTRPNRDLVEIFVDEDMLMQPLRWKSTRRIFVCSQTDLFGEFVTDDMIDRVFAVMALCPQHTFQVLTKRPERMLKWTQGIDDNDGGWIDGECYRDSLIDGEAQNIYCKLHQAADPSEWLAVHLPLPNVWLGVTAENQEWADKRIPLLLQTQAAKRFVSVEPMLGPVVLRQYLTPRTLYVCQRCGEEFGDGEECPSGCLKAQGDPNGDCGDTVLDWVICGGESGHGARPMHPDWARSLRDQCVQAGVPFFFKQWGEWASSGPHNMDAVISPTGIVPQRSQVLLGDGVKEGARTLITRVGKHAAGRLLDGVEWSQFPEECK